MIRSFTNKKGSLTLEACISLIVVTSLSLSISMLLRVVYIETLMQHAITQTANELAAYSYFLSVTGIKRGMDNAQMVTADGRGRVKVQISEIMAVSENFNNLRSSVGSTANSANQGDVSKVAANLPQIADDIEESGESTKQVIMDFVETAANEGLEQFKKAVVLEPLAKSLMQKHLAKGPMGADTHLRKMLVEDGLAGLDLSGSSLFEDKRSIDIIVRYKVKIPSPIPYLPSISILQRAKANAWADDGISVWEMANSMLSGKIIQAEIRNLPESFTTYARYDESTKTATASRRLDITKNSYKSKSQIKRKINGKIYDIENFTKCTRGDITLEKKDISKSVIIFYIPDYATAQQKKTFYEAVEESKNDNSELIIKNNITIQVKEYNKEVPV